MTQDANEKKVRSRIFKSSFKSWDGICNEAAEFATLQGQENVISISHSQEGIYGVAIVWYWSRK